MIYFARNTTNGHIKIGYSKNPHRRITQLKHLAHAPIEMLGVIAGDKRREQSIQEQFEHHSVGHEWFNAGDDLMSQVESLIVSESVTPDDPPKMLAVTIPFSIYYAVRMLAIQNGEYPSTTTGRLLALALNLDPVAMGIEPLNGKESP